MRTKSKGKVHPSPSPLPPSSSSSSKGDDCLSALKLLPAVILVLVSALTPEDKQVLAYLITRSLKTTTNTTKGRSSCDSKIKKSRTHHKAPVSDCECFDCYTSYWLRWDSSPNRELIHQIIEAFEDHHLTNGGEKSLASSSSSSQKSNGRGGKKKDKSGRRRVESDSKATEEPVEPVVVVVDSDEVKSPEILTLPVGAETGHKGLMRKLLPDVMGLFNSRFWRLWNPNA
ncbi:unnamed protein product [Eruca vesicaria subsp. sativa]|uniref:Uncharacterized protein n=1 Tax=Eruca vesicaria subsp. sativa TaxID=29727 RepID=A0ABC8LDP6_ERUVS|nr:unnamed protein product [Eruca vesicaria subsp. sativa]